MIVLPRSDLTPQQLTRLGTALQAVALRDEGRTVLVTPHKLKALPSELLPLVDRHLVMGSDIQLASLDYRPARQIVVGDVVFGDGGTELVAGPCSVEGPEQVDAVARMLVQLGLRVLRAGSFKPRTAPYSFQGMGLEGLRLLRQVCDRHGLLLQSETRDATNVDAVLEYADIVQIGAKSMYDHGILRACGRARKPIVLKRGFGTTLQELVQAAEFILSGGNPDVILCERGVRTFETKTRFTLDLCGVAWLKQHVNLPVMVDPSHAMGWAYGVPDLTRAAYAMGVDGLLIEVHPHPASALSDASQQLDLDTFRRLFASLRAMEPGVGRPLHVAASVAAPGSHPVPEAAPVLADPVPAVHTFSSRFPEIALLVLDVDGVLTDGGMFYGESGEQLKKFNAKDGISISRAQRAGVQVAFLSSGYSSRLIRERGRTLGVTRVFNGDGDKLQVLDGWRCELGLEWSQVAYIGDDYNDLTVMGAVGVSACPADAAAPVIRAATICLRTVGGRGCVREFVESYLLGGEQQ